MTMIGKLSVPSDPMNQILSYLDVKSLGRMQGVSQKLYTLAGNDEIWKNLFKRAYGVDLPPETIGKEILKNSLIIRNKKELIDTVVTFLCHVQWNKKTRLECVFLKSPSTTQILPKESFSVEGMLPSQTPTVMVEQSFGPQRGTRESMNSSADETKYACFIGDVKQLSPTETTILDCETNSNIPYFTQIRNPIEFLNWQGILSSYFEADIKGVDVGYGNTLGYFSSINQWKEPFELFCIPDGNGHHKWAGLIPSSEFKFVKIEPSGKITWENTSNRYWGPRSSGRPYSWEGYLKQVPVSFDA